MIKKNRIIGFFIVLVTLIAVISTTVFNIASDVKLGLDLQGGVEILYDVEALDDEQEVTPAMLDATVESLRQRVDVLGVSEPSFTIEEPNRVRVQLAGIQNEDDAREILQTTAQLSFRNAEDEVMLSGADLVEGGARQDFDSNTNQPIVTLQLKDGAQFGNITRTILEDNTLQNVLVIWLDYEEGDQYIEEFRKEPFYTGEDRLEGEPKYISAPSIRNVINSAQVQIDGNFSVDEAKQLADLLNAGSLPVDLTEVYTTSVSAQFGVDALNQTLFAGALGILFIFIFMLAIYRFGGVITVITLSLYIYLVVLVFELMNGVLTLPGIAALILGVGMAVDANIITFERMKEELREGKSMIASFESANKNSLSTILDANITTLIAATVLFIYGTSSVKGFATLLIVSIVLSFITTVFISRFLMGLWIKSRTLDKRPHWIGVKKEQIRSLSDTTEEEPKFFGKRIDFVQHRKKYFIASGALIVVGIISMLIAGLNLSIDFTSGTRIEVNTVESISEEAVFDHFEQFDYEPDTVTFAGDNNEVVVIRLSDQLSQEEVAEVRSYFNELYDTEASISTVSPVVGQQLARNAMIAVAIASVFIVIYVTIRFEINFAIAAIIALLHDAFFILAVFSLTQVEFNVTIVAAILTIVGYSINDTIVNFDRIRENVRKKKTIRSYDQLARVVNDSLIQTLVRSINTVVTVIVAAIFLWIFGAPAITNFSFALVIGLFAGMYSSNFIAAQLWLVFRGRNIKEKPIVFVEKKRNDGPQV
ncbi:protein translocase subunit SecDF [Halolactibacillus alkaliphilus]|uniref:Multifunctional fusion protein n=1 Tax=Halolactibacillus alkaliphilus TaxID=442899 RepID=A0A511WZB7_9BACI|nr:protein translocase subunit SecD [Halolactibacillus alkaliphilus]GEN56028.1 protein translocase subunit SecDF [Halolactibacillus alkaliphilus]GGN68044.1 protein translocase subunit SecDF [Halolactibacillus alkaliphilus]SFO69874.1 SecD/SecF fusion protein [Halolactibacillus alkaliphilus]